MMGTEKGKAYLSHLQKKPNEPFMFFYRQNSYPYTPVAFFYNAVAVRYSSKQQKPLIFF